MTIAKNIIEIRDSLPKGITLVAVSKTKSNNEIMEAYDTGQRVFGENKVQELMLKYEELPKDIAWHFIGHLQSNKVKYITPFVSLIHGVDSLKLLKTIHKEAKKNDRIIPCLLQFHIAHENTKFGFLMDEIEDMKLDEVITELKNVNICGVMGMATYTDDQTQIAKEFEELSDIFNRLKNTFFKEQHSFKEISMGMSNDYVIAIEKGSTMIRVGSSIFGSRNY